MDSEVFKKILIEAIGDKGTVEISLNSDAKHRFCVNNTDGIPISILEYEIENNTIVIIDKMFTEAKSFDLHDPNVFTEIKEFIFPIINQKEYLNKVEESNLKLDR